MEELYLKEIELKDEKDIVGYINEFVREGSVINGLSGGDFKQKLQRNV